MDIRGFIRSEMYLQNRELRLRFPGRCPGGTAGLRPVFVLMADGTVRGFSGELGTAAGRSRGCRSELCQAWCMRV